MKKILKSIFVCIIMITTLLASVNYIKADDSEATYDGIKYKINTAERWATVCGYTGTDKDVKIPNMIGRGIIVSEIADHAFDGCSTIRVLTIPDTIMKVGDMSFIGMDNLQAIISKTEGINIVVKENVQIVSDRSELGDIDMDSNNTSSGNDSKGDSGNTSGSSDNNSGNNRIEAAKSIDGEGIIIDSDKGIITDSSNGNIQIGSNVDSESSDSAKNEISDGNGVISDNKTNNNTAEKSDNNNNEAGTSQSNKSSTTKVVVTIICIILVTGLATGLFIYMKKKKR